MFTFIKTISYIPLYNAFVLLLALPGIDAGVAVVIFTLIIKVALFPLQKKALLTQIRMKEVEPALKKIKAEIKDIKEQGQAIMKLYKEKKINPLSSFFILLIQLPILISLYHIFSSGALSQIDNSILYSFVHPKEVIVTTFLGLFDVTQKNVLVAFIAAASQFVQAHFQPMFFTSDSKEKSFQNDLARSMSVQMKYVFPVVIFFITFTLPSVIALYFITSNIFMVFQELALRSHRKKFTVPGVSN